MTSRQVLELLRARHSDALFVDECKDGPSASCEHVRLDAWVLPRSWSHLTTIGYEIKVSRGDFLRDVKWQAYLPLCHELNFVCPHALIAESEVPQGVGLLWVSRNEARLITKRRAPRRDIEWPIPLLIYVLMCRAKMEREIPIGQDAQAFWRQYLADKREDTNFGHVVGKKIGEVLRTRIAAVETQNSDLQSQIRAYANVVEWLRSAGIDPTTDIHQWGFERRVKAAIGADLPPALAAARQAIERAEQAIAELSEPKKQAKA